MTEEAIFAAAIEKKTPDERVAYLDQACAGDAELRAKVEGLLKAHDNPDVFLDDPVADLGETMDHASISEHPGATIGPYKLREQVGEGGMGVVFVAEQERPVRRKVALKIIKPGMDTKEVIARFEAERQALALMDHPNIAKVLDAGSTGAGRPYFVMELVRGIPITGYCDQNKLSIRERLELFIQVCQAIQHAHQKGIIHRDVKPSNVLVSLHDGKPVPKVIDFGVAKATNQRLTERTIYTRFTQIIGTPMYMSPEQADLSGVDVDTRSDIYSLGVLLYELLTGTTPLDKSRFEKAAYDEIRRIVREEDPPKPSTKLSLLGASATSISEQRQSDPRKLQQLIRGDLDWIVMKTLEKDRTRRYDTASAFAADIQRLLENQPIEARPPSAVYRVHKAMIRHRISLAMSLIAVIAILSICLGAAGVWVADRSRRQTLNRFRELFLEHGFNLIMNSQPESAKTLIGQLEQAQQDEAVTKLRAALHLHTSNAGQAIVLLEPAVQRYPDDVGLRAMLTDAYDQAGDIDRFVQSYERLRRQDASKLHSVELIYAVFAHIAEPKAGWPLADRAVQENPTSPYARLARGRIAANWVHRSFDPSTAGLDDRQLELMDQALYDVELLKWLYEHDERIPPLALSTYLFVSSTRRRQGDVNWRQTLHMADDVVSFLEANSRKPWTRFFLAEYYRENGDDDYARDRMWNLYSDAALEDQHDYATNFYLALCHEMDRPPASQLAKRIANDRGAMFAKYGIGCWYALHDERENARQQVRGLMDVGTIGAVNGALYILLLLKEETAAAQLVKEYRSTAMGREQLASVGFIDRRIYQFFEEALTGSSDARNAARGRLLSTARDSDYPAEYGSFAHWAIGLRHWAKNETEEALRSFEKCAGLGQFEFPHHAWSRAIMARVRVEKS